MGFKHQNKDQKQSEIYRLLGRVLQTKLLIVFLAMSMFPAQALAFVDEVELSQKPLFFALDDIDSSEALGIVISPGMRTVTGILNSSSIMANSTLMKGSVVRVLSTAYSSVPDQTDASPFTTASGDRVHRGTMAANFLPFGTQVKIGSRVFIVSDRMNSRYSGKYIVDIWMPDRASAIKYGVKVVHMKILSMP